MMELAPNLQQRLETERNIWIASVRPDGRPHLTPVWFVWHDKKLWLCISPNSVKGRNIAQNPRVVLALEDGSSPVICEGVAAAVAEPWLAVVVDLFQQKYNWSIIPGGHYSQLVVVRPVKWLMW